MLFFLPRYAILGGVRGHNAPRQKNLKPIPKMTNKQIRSNLLSDSRNLSVRITRKGEVIVRTTRARGDGGKTPWTMLAGYVTDPQFASLSR